MRANAGAKSPSCSRTAVCLTVMSIAPVIVHVGSGRKTRHFLTRRTTARLCRKCRIRSEPSPVIHFHAQPCMIRMDQETAKRPRARSLRAFGKEASEPYIRVRSASTSSSVVAQLVARRTIVWLSSGFSQKLMPTFSERVWYLSSGSLTKVWFVVELKRS